MQDVIKKVGVTRWVGYAAPLAAYVEHPRLCDDYRQGKPCINERCTFAHSNAELVMMWQQVIGRVRDAVICAPCLRDANGEGSATHEGIDRVEQLMGVTMAPLAEGVAVCEKCNQDVGDERPLYRCGSLSAWRTHLRDPNAPFCASDYVPIPPKPRSARSIKLCRFASCGFRGCRYAHAPVILVAWVRAAAQDAARAAAARKYAMHLEHPELALADRDAAAERHYQHITQQQQHQQQQHQHHQQHHHQLQHLLQQQQHHQHQNQPDASCPVA